jgi:hypothetical protein
MEKWFMDIKDDQSASSNKKPEEEWIVDVD